MKRNLKKVTALLLCLFTLFTIVQTSVFALPTTTLTQAVVKPSQVKNVKVTAGTNYVTLKWDKASNAQKYFVFSYNTSTKKYTCLGNTTNLTYKISNLKANTTYRFAVQAARKVSGKYYYGAVSAYVTVKTKAASSSSTVAKVSGLKITTSGKSGYLKLSWNSQSSVSGYQVYRSTTGKSDSYQKIATLKGNQLSYTNSGLKSSTPYYYAVRAYKSTSKGNVYGSFAYVNLSTKLTRSGLKKIINGANKCYFDWIGGEAVRSSLDKSDHIDGDFDYYYRVKSKTVSTKKDVKTKMLAYFSESLCNELLYGEFQNYIEKNGKLYYMEPMELYGPEDYLELVSMNCSDKKCTFKVTRTVPDYDYYSSTFSYTIKYSNGRWVYSEEPILLSASLLYGNDPWLN